MVMGIPFSSVRYIPMMQGARENGAIEGPYLQTDDVVRFVAVGADGPVRGRIAVCNGRRLGSRQIHARAVEREGQRDGGARAFF